MCAALSESAQSPAVVELLLKAEADVNATDYVSAWEGDGVGCYMYGVAGRWAIVGWPLYGG